MARNQSHPVSPCSNHPGTIFTLLTADSQGAFPNQPGGSGYFVQKFPLFAEELTLVGLSLSSVFFILKHVQRILRFLGFSVGYEKNDYGGACIQGSFAGHFKLAPPEQPAKSYWLGREERKEGGFIAQPPCRR